MGEIISSIFIGVFSGIFTSLVIWIFIQISKRIIIPWYQQNIYRGIDLTGQWNSKQLYPEGISAEQSIELIQKGHLISGSLMATTKFPNNSEETNSYTIRGETFDNYLDVEYRITDKSKIGRGSLLLKVKRGGNVLEGALISIDRISTEIITQPITQWNRKK